jgi:hypothetical protein
VGAQKTRMPIGMQTVKTVFMKFQMEARELD